MYDSYKRRMPPVQFAMELTAGYRTVRYGGVEGFLEWVGYVFAGMFVMSVIFWVVVPSDKLYEWLSWTAYAVLVLVFATATLGHEVIKKKTR